MWKILKSKKNKDIHIIPYELHNCKNNIPQLNKYPKIYIDSDEEYLENTGKYRLYIELNKKDCISIDINYCPFCGKKL